ncbi:type II toxin-antitoxin system CcdA family antitoxin [Azonexus sp.]|uniref:type II toxin-antitoxin system CcdA family antitoxin n=1 Tax=Azonexus sp. TaxID=1872668 RepID=UPI0027B91B0B|nr:type II toxin-antitoxin system CcdA family antitoxin [Azonexus sp.]
MALLTSSTPKSRLSLSISRELLERLEPYKHEINFSAEAEQLFTRLLEQRENRDWAKRNADALVEHGRAIAANGLAGSEFERI